MKGGVLDFIHTITTMGDYNIHMGEEEMGKVEIGIAQNNLYV